MGEKPLEKVVIEVIRLFDGIRHTEGNKPKVGLLRFLCL